MRLTSGTTALTGGLLLISALGALAVGARQLGTFWGDHVDHAATLAARTMPPAAPPPEVSPPPAPHAEAPRDALEFVRATQTELRSLLAGLHSQQDVVALVARRVDMLEAAKRCFGEAWNILSEAQKVEARELAGQLVAQSVGKYLGEALGTDVRWALHGNVVRADIAPSKPAETPIEMRFDVNADASGWHFVDVTYEGSRTSRNYSHEIEKFIKKGGYPLVAERMRAKLARI